MSRIDWLNWSFALTFSLSLHALLVLYKNEPIISAPADSAAQHIIHIRFSSYTPEIEQEQPETEPRNEPEPEFKPQPEVIIKPKPEPKPEAKPITKPKPIAKPKPKPRPKPESLPKPSTNLQSQQPVSMQPRQALSSSIAKKPDPELLSQTRQTYQALLLRHIEVHKIYPKAARRRKIEGKIQISFTLFADGSIKHLQINGKRSMLKKASRQAIDGALPMPRPPGELTLPIKIQFTMNYFLK